MSLILTQTSSFLEIATTIAQIPKKSLDNSEITYDALPGDTCSLFACIKLAYSYVLQNNNTMYMFYVPLSQYCFVPLTT